ncbi:hypothetical protein [Bradyrhizobium elkanii]|uniref:hypothetical protein n=1 Tax=Bradyrhizobium elkanii TaxID=29448 RepID=UPI002FF1AE7D
MKAMKVLGLAAVGAVLVLAAPAERASAMSLATPGTAATVQDNANQTTTQVRWGGRGWHRGWHRGHHRGWGIVATGAVDRAAYQRR